MEPQNIDALINAEVERRLAEILAKKRKVKQSLTMEQLSEEQRLVIAKLRSNDQGLRFAREAVRNRGTLINEGRALLLEAETLNIPTNLIANALKINQSSAWSRVHTAKARAKSKADHH